MPLLDDIGALRKEVLAVAARHGVSNVRIFGSVARRQEGEASDVDLLVDLDEGRGFSDYLAFVDALEALVGRRVEVVIERSLSPHFRPYIETEARPL